MPNKIEQIVHFVLAAFPSPDYNLRESPEMDHLTQLLGLQSWLKGVKDYRTQTDAQSYLIDVGQLAQHNPGFVAQAELFQLPQLGTAALSELREAVVYSYLLDLIAHTCLWEPKHSPNTPSQPLLAQLVSLLDQRLTQTDWKKQANVFEKLKIQSIQGPLRNMCVGKGGGPASDAYFQKESQPDNGLILALNILEAMYEDTRLQHPANANAGFELMMEPFGRSPIAHAGNDVNREWIEQGMPMGVWQALPPFPTEWHSLYQAWNLAFCSSYRNNIYFYAKLLNPTVMGTYLEKKHEGLYMWPKLVCLFVHTRYEVLRRTLNRPTYDWHNDSITLQMGRMSERQSELYRLRLIHELPVYTRSRKYQTKRKAALQAWSNFAQLIQPGEARPTRPNSLIHHSQKPVPSFSFLLQLFSICAHVYTDHCHLELLPNYNNCILQNTLVTKTTKVTFWTSEQLLVVGFRGSESKTDIVTGLQLRKVNLNPANPDILIHSGIKYIMESVYSLVQAEILKYPDLRQVYLTGHSLGGALATLCAYLLHQDRPSNPPITVVSFGSPPVGNEGWRNAFDQLPLYHCRVINNCDAMNRELFGYHHTGELLQLPSPNCAFLKNHACTAYYHTLLLLAQLEIVPH